MAQTNAGDLPDGASGFFVATGVTQRRSLKRWRKLVFGRSDRCVAPHRALSAGSLAPLRRQAVAQVVMTPCSHLMQAAMHWSNSFSLYPAMHWAVVVALVSLSREQAPRMASGIRTTRICIDDPRPARESTRANSGIEVTTAIKADRRRRALALGTSMGAVPLMRRSEAARPATSRHRAWTRGPDR